MALAQAQHAAYADALAANGWTVRQAPAADECPDSVFVEDTVVVCQDLAVLTRPGTPARRAEVAGVAQTVQALGLQTARIQAPGLLDGGDVLQVGNTVYVGRGGRTNAESIRQLRRLLAPLGRTVVPVPLGKVLHLKSAVTALPDGTLLLLPGLVPAELFPSVRAVEEEGGSHVWCCTCADPDMVEETCLRKWTPTPRARTAKSMDHYNRHRPHRALRSHRRAHAPILTPSAGPAKVWAGGVTCSAGSRAPTAA